MTVIETRRPSRGIAVLVWIGLALSVYGIAAVFGLGGLTDALDGIPGVGLVGGFFVGLALLGIPAVAGWAAGRPLPIVPFAPRMSALALWAGTVGTAVIGLVAVLVDLGFLNIEVVGGA